MIKRASFSEPLDNQAVACHLCPANCKLREGKRGICFGRFNKGGKLFTENYGELVTMAVDPIEKKPLYHFYPGKDILSTGANTCNFACLNCQNWAISQERAKTIYFSPDKLTEAAVEHRSIGVAFTYTEPMVWFEYILDTSPLLREAGLKSVLVSNGYINSKPLDQLLDNIDAINIDLKGMRPEFYKKVCKAKLEPVLESIKAVAESDVHLEITNLLIPTHNDSDDEIKKLVDFIANISDDIPLHLSAYHPDFKMDIPATPTDTLLKAREIASDRLKYVYLGNVSEAGLSDTKCPECEAVLIKRDFYRSKSIGLAGNCCLECGYDTGIII